VHVGFSLLTLFPGRVGGAETYVRGLLDAYARGDGPQRLTVLANRHVMRAYADAGVPLREVRSYRPGDRDATRFAAMSLARLAPRLAARDVPRDLDVLHLPVTVPVGVVPGVPRVVSLLDVQHHELPQMFGRAERAFRAWAYDDSARRADLVVTISEHAKAGIVRHLGLDPARIEVIGLGVDHERFTPEGPARDGLGDYVYYPANLWPHKNHDRLLEAFAAVDDSLSLVLTGQTFGRTVSGPRVRHLGHVPFAEIPALYRGARAVVFPSLFEGFGVPVLEAMACGTPVATSDRGSLGEIAGDAAITFDPEDVPAITAAIERVARDEALRSRLRDAGRAHAARFTWRQAAQRHLAVYERARRAAPAAPPRPSRSRRAR
jgi:glycosyltransferase involved in cell wall biosynthesis